VHEFLASALDGDDSSSNFIYRPFFPGDIFPLPSRHKAGWPQRPSGCLGEKKQIFLLSGI
jgi:hypothetical protein